MIELKDEFVRKEINYDRFIQLKKSVSAGKNLSIKIEGNSMRPVLQETARISLTPGFDHASLKKFDVIVFWRNKLLICHYLWEIDESAKKIITRPLNPMWAFDEPITPEQILGKVASVRINVFLKIMINVRTFFGKKS